MADRKNDLRGNRILVTGAAGFIGSRLVGELLNNDAEVIALVDKGTNLARINPLLTDSGLRLIRCPLTDTQALLAQRQKWGEINLVAHLGLQVPHSNDFDEQFIEDITLNLLPTINLVKILGNSIHGICFASSVSVYGCPTHLPVKESDLPAPISSYGVTKLATENYLRAYGKANQVPVTILRYASVYGPGEFGYRAIPNFLNAVANGQPPQIYGDGSEIRDYVYIDDVVQATISALAMRPNQVLNIGSGQGCTTLHIAQEIIRLYSANLEPQFLPAKGQVINLTCDISAAKEVLSYSPQINLENGLRREIEWYREQVRTSIQKDKKEKVPIPKSKRGLRRLFTYSSWKNVADRLVAFLCIIISSPLLALIALTIKLDLRESPIFTQERVGKDSCQFVAYKFRTMHTNSNDEKYKEYIRKYVLENAPYRVDGNGQGIYKVDDCRITRIGALLRRINLDELPQLFNVLKGDMSIIGPRPDIPFAVSMYKDWHRKRLSVKPGITGLWQVCGRKCIPFEGMVRLDIDYIKRQSLLLDTKIMFLTIGTILRSDGS